MAVAATHGTNGTSGGHTGAGGVLGETAAGSPADEHALTLDPADGPGEAHEEEDRNSPLRRCIASGTSGPRTGMVRFVVGPDGRVVPDVDESLPGRGLWLTADREMAEKAVARNAFSRAARRAVKAGPDVLEQARERLLRRCLDTIGLARRGGLAVAGYEKVSVALKQRRLGSGARIGLWLEACDGSADGRTKLQGLAAGVPEVHLFSRSQLGAAFGRDDVVHAVLGGGALADRLMRDVGRLAGLGLPAARAVGPV